LAPDPGGSRRGAARRDGSSPRTARARRRGGRRGRTAGARETPSVDKHVATSVNSLRPGANMGGSLVLLIVLVVVVGWLIGAYNGLISLKNQTLNAFKQIDVQLKRRHDLIPNLVNAVKGAMEFERSTLEAVIQARNQVGDEIVAPLELDVDLLERVQRLV